MPLSDSLRVLTNVVIDFDTRLRNPKWVVEHISADKLRGEGARGNSAFFEDAALPPRFRSKLSDYRGSGYDRGHMAPAANHKASQATMDETFSLANAAPQVGAGFNRDSWARLERFVQEMTQTCGEVWVVTGPLYLPQRGPGGKFVMQHDMIGESGSRRSSARISILTLLPTRGNASPPSPPGTPPQLVAVPTHFFQVVLGEVRPGAAGKQGDVAVGAFVMPNSAVDPQAPLAAFVVPLSALEEVSGTRFFPGYLTEERRRALDGAALAAQRAGRAELRRLLPGGAHPALLPAPQEEDVQAAVPLASRGAHGAVHICEHRACRLPPPNWWEDKKKKQKAPA